MATALAPGGSNITRVPAKRQPRQPVTRPGGQPVASGGGNAEGVKGLQQAYVQLRDMPRTAPPGTKNPFQWFLASFTGNWDNLATTSAASSTGSPAASSPSVNPGGPIQIPPSKGALTKAQLEQAWVRNGGNPAAANIASAIALAESSGRLNAAGDAGLGAPGPTSFGPWQVHVPAHPQYKPSLLMSNLNYTTKAAIAISNDGTDWTPWSTYNSGVYKAYLS